MSTIRDNLLNAIRIKKLFLYVIILTELLFEGVTFMRKALVILSLLTSAGSILVDKFIYDIPDKIVPYLFAVSFLSLILYLVVLKKQKAI